MKILLAVDGSPFSEAAAKSVAGRPWPLATEVKIITVMSPLRAYVTEPWVTSSEYWDALEDAAQQQAEQVIEMAAGHFEGRQGLIISSEILKGNPQAAILEEAETWGADRIVLGSHGYTGLKRLFLGSVSHAVMSHAPCSVEIIRDRAFHETAAA